MFTDYCLLEYYFATFHLSRRKSILIEFMRRYGFSEKLNSKECYSKYCQKLDQRKAKITSELTDGFIRKFELKLKLPLFFPATSNNITPEYYFYYLVHHTRRTRSTYYYYS